jgi:hypothetical protein
MSDRPERGVRFRFDRERDEGDAAHYGVTIALPEREWGGVAILTDAGVVNLQIDAPDDLRAMAEMFAKLVARGAAQRRTDGLVVWPARIIRWREPK